MKISVLLMMQSWTHLAFYGKNSVEIFTRRITKFRGVSSGCEIRCVLRDAGTRSSWHPGVKADIASGTDAKILFRIFLRARCFYLAHFPEAGDSSVVQSIVSIPEFLIRPFTVATVALRWVPYLATLASALFVSPNKRVVSFN